MSCLGETVWEHPGTGEHSLAAVADLRDPDTPTPTTEGSPPPQVQQQPQTEQAPSENSKDTASFFGRLLGRRKSSSEEIPPPPAAAAPAATGATKDAPELYLEGEALAAAVEALRKDAKARGEASAAVRDGLFVLVVYFFLCFSSHNLHNILQGSTLSYYHPPVSYRVLIYPTQYTI